MQTAMLLNHGPAVNTNNFPVRKSLTDSAQSLCVEVGLVISGHQHSPVDNQVVGIGGWQTLTFVVDGAGQRQLTIGLTVQRPQCLQFLFHERQIRMVFVAPSI